MYIHGLVSGNHGNDHSNEDVPFPNLFLGEKFNSLQQAKWRKLLICHVTFSSWCVTFFMLLLLSVLSLRLNAVMLGRVFIMSVCLSVCKTTQ